MAYKENEKTLSADITLAAYDALKKQRTERSQVQKDVVEAAITLWISLRPEFQAMIISKADSPKKAYEMLRLEVIVDYIRSRLASMSPEQQNTLLATLPEVKAKIFPTDPSLK